MPASGKTTVLDHLSRLCHRPVQASALSSSAVLPRLLTDGPRTILIDEVDRVLQPGNGRTQDLLAVINSGYRVGAVTVVVAPDKTVRQMPTFAPLAMAGNAPNLPDDTRSREIRILLMPDLDGTVEDSDWEVIADEAKILKERVTAWSAVVSGMVKGLAVALPDGCVGRTKEKWRPLKRGACRAGRWLTGTAVAAAVAVRGGWTCATRATAKSAAPSSLPVNSPIGTTQRGQ